MCSLAQLDPLADSEYPIVGEQALAAANLAINGPDDEVIHRLALGFDLPGPRKQIGGEPNCHRVSLFHVYTPSFLRDRPLSQPTDDTMMWFPGARQVSEDGPLAVRYRLLAYTWRLSQC